MSPNRNALNCRSRQNGKNLTESQRFTNADSTALDVTEGTEMEERLKRTRGSRITIDTVPTFAWCNRPDGSNEFLTGAGWIIRVFRLRRRGLGVESSFTLKMSRDYYMYGGRCSHGGTWELEARLRRLDGVYRRLLFRFEPLSTRRKHR